MSAPASEVEPFMLDGCALTHLTVTFVDCQLQADHTVNRIAFRASTDRSSGPCSEASFVVQEGGVVRADDAHVFCTARLANSVRRVQTQQASPRQNSAGRLGASELLPPSLQAPLVGCKATWTTTTRCTFELHKVNWHAPATGRRFFDGAGITVASGHCSYKYIAHALAPATRPS